MKLTWKRGNLCWELRPSLKCDLVSEAEQEPVVRKGAVVMEGTGELVCEQASISSNITTFYAQMIAVAQYTFYH